MPKEMKLKSNVSTDGKEVQSASIAAIVTVLPGTAFAMAEEVAGAAIWLFLLLLASVVSWFLPLPRKSFQRFIVWAIRFSVPTIYAVLVMDNKYFYRDRIAKRSALEAIAHQPFQTCRQQLETAIYVAHEAKSTRPLSICVIEEPTSVQQSFSGNLAKCLSQKLTPACKGFDLQFIESSGPLLACSRAGGHYSRWDIHQTGPRVTTIEAPVSKYIVRFTRSNESSEPGFEKHSITLESRDSREPLATTQILLDSANRGCPQSPEDVVAKMLSLVFSN